MDGAIRNGTKIISGGVQQLREQQRGEKVLYLVCFGTTANGDEMQQPCLASHQASPHTQEPVSIRVALLYLLPLANG